MSKVRFIHYFRCEVCRRQLMVDQDLVVCCNVVYANGGRQVTQFWLAYADLTVNPSGGPR